MTIQEEIRDAVMPILKDIQDEGYVMGTSCLSVHYKEILRVLHSKGVVIKTGIGKIVADSPCTIEVPIVESLIEEVE